MKYLCQKFNAQRLFSVLFWGLVWSISYFYVMVTGSMPAALLEIYLFSPTLSSCCH